MIAETILACWLIASVYLPLLHALTRDPPVEVRRVTNALVMQRAKLCVSEPSRPSRVLRFRAAPKTAPAEHTVAYAVEAA